MTLWLWPRPWRRYSSKRLPRCPRMKLSFSLHHSKAKTRGEQVANLVSLTVLKDFIISHLFLVINLCRHFHLWFYSWVIFKKLNMLHISATGAQQVPAVSQSVYSPSSSDTGESIQANSPHTVLTKNVPPANVMGLPPTQPTTKVEKKVEIYLGIMTYKIRSLSAKMYRYFSQIISFSSIHIWWNIVK